MIRRLAAVAMCAGLVSMVTVGAPSIVAERQAEPGIEVLARMGESGLQRLAIEGERLYAVLRDTLFVYDVADPEHVVAVHRTSLGANDLVGRIVVQDDIVAIAAGRHGLLLLRRVADGPGFSELSRWTGGVDASFAHQVAIHNGTAYVLSSSMLSIVDVRDPSRPTLLGQARIARPGGVFDVVVSDGIIFVASGSEGLRVIDARDPLNPREASALDPDHGLDMPVYAVAASGATAYVGAGLSGVLVVDVADPSNPRIVRAVEMPNFSYVRRIALEGGRLHVAHDTGYALLDVAEPQQPTFVRNVETPGEAWDVAVHGEVVYLASPNAGILQITDRVAADEAVRVVDAFPGPTAGAVAMGTTAYLVSERGIVRAFEIADSSAPKYVGSVDTGMTSWSMASGDSFVVVAGPDGYAVVDVTRPDSMAVSGRMKTDVPQGTASIAALTVEGGRLYSAHGGLGDQSGLLRIYDVSRRDEPSYQGAVAIAGVPTALVAAGTKAYVATDSNGLHVVDVTDPYRPTVRGALRTGIESSWSIAMDGAHVVLGGTGRVSVVDVADPQQPRLVGSIAVDDGQPLTAIAAYGGLVLAGSTGNGSYLFGLDDPAHPVLLAHAPRIGFDEVRGLGDGRFVGSAGDAGAVLLRVQPPANPQPSEPTGVPPLPTRTPPPSPPARRIHLPLVVDGHR